MSFQCRDCDMAFATSEELANHKNNFCVDSEWHDPELLREQLDREENADVATNNLSFEEITVYYWLQKLCCL